MKCKKSLIVLFSFKDLLAWWRHHHGRPVKQLPHKSGVRR